MEVLRRHPGPPGGAGNEAAGGDGRGHVRAEAVRLSSSERDPGRGNRGGSWAKAGEQAGGSGPSL